MPRCKDKECKKKIFLTDLECKYCKKRFCMLHRLPEIHKCDGLNEAKKLKHEEQKESLLKNAAKTPKIIKI